MAGDFRGTDRFEVRRRVGAGAFGVVYEAFDRERGAPVALKTLTRVEPVALYRFKQEFRALADAVHPNLVALHELFSEGDDWFFTMELLEGVGFLDWVRPGGDPKASDTLPVAPGSMAAALAASGSADVEAAAAPARTPARSERLRPALRQLASGIAALHARGTLHRDIKPSNVLVTPEGRVVLLDFGLATDLGGADEHADRRIVGTALYMAPEQAAAHPLTEASDWYAVGAVLYEALTGRAPFVGTVLEVLRQKTTADPPPPGTLVAGVDADLEALCLALLHRNPAARPGGAEVLRRLGAGDGDGGPGAPGASSASGAPESLPGEGRLPLVGRARHLAALAAAYHRAHEGDATVALVHGPSGMGKTALVRRFLDGLGAERRAVVLAGRCYERESVPYKALDSVVDALARHLARLPAAEAEALLPPAIHDLARVFPVLRRAGAVERAPRPAFETPDPQEQRRRAFAVLRDLLARLAGGGGGGAGGGPAPFEPRPVVLAIDDVQWGDEDSAALLGFVLKPPDPPPILLLLAYRAEEAAGSPFLRAFLGVTTAPLRDATSGAALREVEVGALEPEHARELALALLGAGAAAARRADEIAREAHGNPYFVAELARYVHEGAALRPDAPGGTIALERVISARVSRLAEADRRLLEAVAVASGPLDLAVAAPATGLDAVASRAAAGRLAAANLVRVRGPRGQDEVETFHDRIRVTVVGALAADARRDWNRRLGDALEAWGRGDAETLLAHFLAAGARDRAAAYAARAGDESASALAFEHAAHLYRLALDLGGDGAPDAGAGTVRSLRARLGDALASAGRGPEAADAYLDAARAADGAGAPGDARELRRRAADQLLRSGHMDRGLECLREVLAAVDLRLAPTPLRALLGLLLRRALVRLRGLGFRERPAAEVGPGDLARIDTCWSVSASLSTVDTVRGADFQTRHLLLALRAGEPYRVARALAMEGAYAAAGGGARGFARAERVGARALALAERLDHPHGVGVALTASGAVAFLEGRFRVARERCERGLAVYRDRCTGVAWEAVTAQLFWIWSTVYVGEIGELSARLPGLVAEARERGDVYADVNFRTGLANLVWLAGDDPERARREADGALAAWSSAERGFHQQHYRDLYARTQIDFYAGRGAEAHERLGRSWRALARSLLLRLQLPRIEMVHLRARAALAAAQAEATSSARPALQAAAARDARRLEKERRPWADPLARLVRAALAAARGDREGAAETLALAEQELEAQEMALYAAAARRRRGELSGGERGRALVASADAAMRARGVARPAAMANVLAPGFAPG